MKNEKLEYCLGCKKSFTNVERFENTNLCKGCFPLTQGGTGF